MVSDSLDKSFFKTLEHGWKTGSDRFQPRTLRPQNFNNKTPGRLLPI